MRSIVKGKNFEEEGGGMGDSFPLRFDHLGAAIKMKMADLLP